MANTFCYGKLNPDNDEIRILRAKSKAHSDRDHATEYELELEIRCIYEVPEYYAVSYRVEEADTTTYQVWGDESQRTPLQVDGQELMVPFNTAKAVESVLSALPKLHGVDDQIKGFRIWIDAICINQSDHDERARQVSRMRSIYQGAVAVIICLGDHVSAEKSRAAVHSAYQIFDSWMHAGYDYTSTERDMFGHNFPTNLLVSVGPIYESPWFERVWTIQESGLAHKAWCLLGGSTLPLYQITIAAAALTARLYHIMPKEMINISRGLELVNERQRIKTLSRQGRFYPIVKAALRYCATDPRDMVYGVMGLITEYCKSIPNEIDYNCPIRVLYAQVTVKSVILSQSLEPLQLAALQSEGGPNAGFASWSMRLDRGKSTTLDPLRPQFANRTDNGHWFDTIHDLPARTMWKTLRLRGAIFDEVVCALKLDCLPEIDDQEFVKRIISIHGAINASKAASAIIAQESLRVRQANLAVLADADPLRNAVANVLTAGLYAKDGYHVSENYKRMQNFQARINGFPGRDELGTILKQHHQSFTHTKPFQRTFLITKEGRLGLGPLTALPGDQVCVINGGSVPFVLRQEEESWRLMGDAYIRGLDQEKRWQDIATLCPNDKDWQFSDIEIQNFDIQ